MNSILKRFPIKLLQFILNVQPLKLALSAKYFIYGVELNLLSSVGLTSLILLF